MSKHNIYFIILGVILIGIALLTEYASTKLTSNWTMAINDVSDSVRQPSVESNNIAFAGTNNTEDFFTDPLQNLISRKIGTNQYFIMKIEVQGRNL
jgi:hypothetical protein